MLARESQERALERWDDLHRLQEEYAVFADFLHDVQLAVYGWDTTDVQFDIGNFLQYGGRYIMIQAQRGQAKTTITAIFAVWCLIHDPAFRVVILSAGGDKATEIAIGIIKIIQAFDVLECMRPDAGAGDRTSSKAFDIHYTLRGEGMNPSIKCMGVTANLQGTRADLLVPDDIESTKNGLTQVQRDALTHITRDFTSICTEGRIVYLGTPQTVDSVYNGLPGRGYTIRIWPGRFPTEEEQIEYGNSLAPFILARIQEDPALMTGGGITGDCGKAIDPRLNEQVLQDKEIDQGPAYFKLQHMLCTKLSDSERFPLKTRNLIVMYLDDEEAPGKIVWQPNKEMLIPMPAGTNVKEELYSPARVSEEMFPYEGRMMYVDTAGGGQNGDETVAAVVYFLHGYIFLMDIIPLPGGIREDVFDTLSKAAYRWQVNGIQVEKNFGNGAFAEAWRPLLAEYYCTTSDGAIGMGPVIEDVWESGQKELRIIDCLEPVTARHKLIINQAILEKDVATAQKYPAENRSVYQFLHQFSRITRDRDALIHDDRLDAVASAVRFFIAWMGQNEDKAMAMKAHVASLQMMADPFGRGTVSQQQLSNGLQNGNFNAFRSIQNRR
jgi:hypothetical protein